MKRRISTTKVNLIYNIAYQILSMILPLITAPYVSRVLGAGGVGKYSYSASVAMYFVYFGMLGVLNYGNRSIAKVRDNYDERCKTFSSIYYLQIMTAGIAIIFYVMYVIFFSGDIRTLSWIQLIYVLSALFDISWLFFGLEEFKLTAQRQMILRIITLILIFTIVKGSEDLNKYAAIICGSNCMNAVLLWFFLPGRAKFCKVTIKNVVVHFKPCLVLFVPLIAMSVFGAMDKIMIGRLVSYDAAGWYENADKIVLMSASVFASFNAVLMPKISNLLSKNDKDSAARYFGISMEFVSFLAIAISFGMIAVAQEFVPVFYGDGYEPTIALMKGLAVGVPFIGWAQIYRVLYLVPAGKDQIYLKSTVYGAIINFILNLTLISIMGAMGAVWATVVSQIAIVFFQAVQVKEEIHFWQYAKSIALYYAVGIVMLIAVRGIANCLECNLTGLLIEVLAGSAMYLLGSFAVLYITKGKEMKQLLPKLRRNKC